MANRKDAKGRVLKAGESQRKDGSYMYRYTDIYGNRKSTYAKDLKELRQKEKGIQRDLDDGVDYSAGEITAIDLIKRYLRTKGNLKETSEMQYQDIIHVLERYALFHKKIGAIKPFEAKEWVAQMHDERKSSTIRVYLGLIGPAFDQACDDNILRKNPFKLKSSEYTKDDQASKEALTPDQQKAFLDFVLSDKTCKRHYDDYNILLGTGLRISEYLGLTIHDIDLVNRVIHVDHQLVLTRGECKITSLKSKSGKRDLFISDSIYESIVRKIHTSSKRDNGVEIDGYTGFLNISRNGYGVTRRGVFNAALKKVIEKYNEQFPDSQLPHIAPHTLRHTFCTNMARGGIDIKSLQYVMGHSDVKVTLAVYTHVSTERALDEMKRIIESSNCGLEAM